ncbi:MAG TPA: peptidoglycan editing factor PgeF [Bryobacteraceae bacterium]|nr:peptidoglycan editing factor PgeF [Bryobacteraceae bacterium]
MGLLRLDADQVYRAPELEQLSWLRHGFGTRLTTNWPNVDQLATARQIHSDRVLVAHQTGVIGEGDALISNQPGIYLAIRTADCLPVLIADARNRAVAAVHAGWRGTVSGIISATLESLGNEFGSRPEDLRVAIGPGIGVCCFEVGPEVAIQFQPFFPERGDFTKRTQIDLAETITRQLRRNGVTESQIASSRLCTYCDVEHFESYRRQREAAGRMVAAIGISGQ